MSWLYKRQNETKHLSLSWKVEPASRGGGSCVARNGTPMTNGCFCIFGDSTQMQHVGVSIAVEKPLVGRPFVKERAELGWWFQRTRVYGGEGKTSKRVTRGWSRREFTSQTVSRQRVHWEWLMPFETSKPSPSGIASNKVIPNPFQTSPSTEGQVFKI